jgi:hypothetical protein
LAFGELKMRWYTMPVEDLPAQDYRERAERFHRMAEGLSNPVIAERFEAMAMDAQMIADRKSRELTH